VGAAEEEEVAPWRGATAGARERPADAPVDGVWLGAALREGILFFYVLLWRFKLRMYIQAARKNAEYIITI
jgi:hypothetical protein